MLDASKSLATEYSTNASQYTRLWSPVIRPMSLPLLAALPLKAARRVLDVGAGSGAHFADLKAAAPNARIVGVDRAEGMLRVARARGDELLAVTDAQRLAIHSGTIDVAVMIFVLFHLPDPSAGLREVARVLRDGASVGIVTWGQEPGLPGTSIWKEELDREEARPDPRDPSVMQHAVMNSRDKLERLIVAAGFSSVNVWSSDVIHQWTLDELLEMQAGCGMASRRLASMSTDRRARCVERVRSRMRQLSRAELEYRAEVLLAVAVRPNETLLAQQNTDPNESIGRRMDASESAT